MNAPLIYGRLADALANDWTVHARPEQLPPAGDWNIWVYLAGRGAGKTRAGIEWVRSLKDTVPRIAMVAPTAADYRDVLVEGESGVLATSPNWDRPLLEPSKRRLTWGNAAIATMFSSEEPDRLRGPQHGAALCDEFAAWQNAQEAWDMLMLGLRIGKRPRAMITTTPRPIKVLKDLVARSGQDVVLTRGRTVDNRANLSGTFLAQIVSRYEGARLGRQELDGDILDDVPGALWSRDLIEACRIPKGTEPVMRRIVVAIDPAVSVSETSDATGIIVAGLGDDGHGYILEDLSGKYSPTQWATKAIAAYKRYEADRIVAEANQGGAMVETTLRAVDQDVPISLVHASRGKITRAEPISALFEQRRAHCVGAFPELEDELCSFEPGSTSSPDRLDAMVWGLSDLMVQNNYDGMIQYYRALAEGQAIAPEVAPHGWSFNGQQDSGEKTKLRVPEGISTVFLMSGALMVPDSGIIEVGTCDATALKAAGWAAA
jgi:phage terminase large subunit-like protein